MCLSIFRFQFNPLSSTYSHWSSDGITTKIVNSSVLCISNHLTSFAVLVQVTSEVSHMFEAILVECISLWGEQAVVQRGEEQQSGWLLLSHLCNQGRWSSSNWANSQYHGSLCHIHVYVPFSSPLFVGSIVYTALICPSISFLVPQQ